MISTDTSANVTPKLSSVHGSTLSRQGAASAKWAAAYLLVSAVAFAVTGHVTLVVTHLVLLGVLGWATYARTSAAEVVFDLAPLMIVIALAYAEVPTLIGAFAMPFHDPTIQRLEGAVFGMQPAHVLAAKVPNLFVSELLHAGYLSFYLALSIPPLLLYASRRRFAFSQTVLTLIVTWIVCCAMFAIFPVQGPRFLWTSPPGIPNGPFRWLSASILAAGSARGTAFPSLHMAASLSQTVMAWRWQSRPLRYVMTASTLLIGVGAVYAGYHYAIDMVAGALLGAITTGVVIAVQGRGSRAAGA